MEKKEIKSQNEQNNKVFSQKNKERTFEINFENLATKINELRLDESIYVPERHLRTLEQFFQQAGFSTQTVYEDDKKRILLVSKGKSEMYVLDLGYESWVLRSCSIIFKVLQSKSYTNVYKIISKDIKYRYHIAELLEYKFSS